MPPRKTKKQEELSTEEKPIRYSSIGNIISPCNTITEEYVRKYIKEYGYDLISFVPVKYDMIFSDKDGYKYKHNFMGFKKGVRPWIVGKINPYNIDNIKLYLLNNNINLELISSSINNIKEKLTFKDNEGYFYTISFPQVKAGYNSYKFSNANYFVLENINLWIKKTNKEYTLESKKYINAIEKLLWKCTSKECGEYFEKDWGNISQGIGCPHCKESNGEKMVRNFLKDKFNFEPQYTFEGLVSDANNPLRFDFAVFEDDNKLKCLIEYDGEQHYNWKKTWITKEQFERIQYHDKLKNEYCLKNNIKLIRIRWKDFKNIEKILKNELNIIQKGENIGS